MSNDLENDLQKARIEGARKHLFVCLGPDCCETRDGETLWEFIKQRVKETGVKVMRTKAACFRICTGGPWLVVYPDGIWYGQVTPQRFERILQEHIISGVPVREWIVIRNDLSDGTRAGLG